MASKATPEEPVPITNYHLLIIPQTLDDHAEKAFAAVRQTLGAQLEEGFYYKWSAYAGAESSNLAAVERLRRTHYYFLLIDNPNLSYPENWSNARFINRPSLEARRLPKLDRQTQIETILDRAGNSMHSAQDRLARKRNVG